MASDVEAGKAYVTLYLRRVNFDRQVDEARNTTQQLEAANQQAANMPPAGQPPQPASVEEAGITFGNLGEAMGKGAAMKAGGSVLTKVIPAFRETASAANAAGPAVAQVGNAAAKTAAQLAATQVVTASIVPVVNATAVSATGAATAIAATGTAAAMAAPVMAEIVPAAGAAAPAVAAAGASAGTASVGFGAMAAALAPILIPLAAVAAVAAAVYVAIFKWDELPAVVKLLLLAISPLILVIRALAEVVNVVRTAFSVVAAPFRLAAAAAAAFHATILAIPNACSYLAGAAVRMGQRVASAAVAMAAATGAALARLPGRLAAWSSSMISSVSAAMGATGRFVAKAGAVGAALAGSVVAPLTAAAKQFADYGQEVADVSSEYDVSAEDAAMLMRAAKGTGQSVKELAGQLADGSRDFSRWREEARAAGLVLDGPGVGAALALTQAYQALKSSLQGLWVQLGSAVAPIITESTTLMVAAVRAVTAWVSQNKPLIAQVFRIAYGVATVSGAVATVGGVLVAAGAAISPLTVALGALVSGLALLEYRTGTARGLWAAYGDSIRNVYGAVVSYLAPIVAFAQKTFGAVENAVRGGDIGLAIKVIMSAAKVAWIAGLLEIDRLTQGTFSGVLKNLAAGNWAAAGQAAMLSLQIAWLQGTMALQSIWEAFKSWTAASWLDIVNFADSAWVAIQNAADPVWLKLQDWFNQLATWGRNAFTEAGTYADGFLAVLAKVGQAFGVILKGAALLAPGVGQTMAAAAQSMSALSAGTGQAFDDAVKAAKDRIAKNAKPEQSQTEAEKARAAELERRKKKNLDDLKGRIGQRTIDAGSAEENRILAAEQEAARKRADLDRLQQEQAALGAQAGDAAATDLAAKQKEYDDAVKAAAAARAAAEAKGLQDKDFAKIERATKGDKATKEHGGIVRFSGEALGLALGGKTFDRDKELAKGVEMTVAVLRETQKVAVDTLAAMKAWMGGIGFK